MLLLCDELLYMQLYVGTVKLKTSFNICPT